MTEEEQNNTEQTEEKAEQTTEDAKPSMVQNALNAAQQLKEQNDRMAELIAKQEAITATQVLGGQSEAGKTEEKKEETPKEYRARIEKELAEGKFNNDRG